jgi:hypothetical protein
LKENISLRVRTAIQPGHLFDVPAAIVFSARTITLLRMTSKSSVEFDVENDVENDVE